METIRPSSDLRNHYSEISRQCRESKEWVHITVNGRSDTVIISEAEFRQMRSELELLHMLGEAEEDVEKGRVAPVQDTFIDIRNKLQAMKENEIHNFAN